MLHRYRESHDTNAQHSVDLPMPPVPGATLDIAVDGRKIVVEVVAVEGASIVFRADGKLVRAAVAALGERRVVHRKGEFPSSFARDDGAKKSRQRGAAGGGLEATMHSQVIAVHTSVGVSVKRGEVLVTLEAMKMEMRVAAPFDGVVKAISCAVGDVVEQGRVLVQLATDAAT